MREKGRKSNVPPRVAPVATRHKRLSAEISATNARLGVLRCQYEEASQRVQSLEATVNSCASLSRRFCSAVGHLNIVSDGLLSAAAVAVEMHPSVMARGRSRSQKDNTASSSTHAASSHSSPLLDAVLHIARALAQRRDSLREIKQLVAVASADGHSGPAFAQLKDLLPQPLVPPSVPSSLPLSSPLSSPFHTSSIASTLSVDGTGVSLLTTHLADSLASIPVSAFDAAVAASSSAAHPSTPPSLPTKGRPRSASPPSAAAPSSLQYVAAAFHTPSSLRSTAIAAVDNVLRAVEVLCRTESERVWSDPPRGGQREGPNSTLRQAGVDILGVGGGTARGGQRACAVAYESVFGSDAARSAVLEGRGTAAAALPHASAEPTAEDRMRALAVVGATWRWDLQRVVLRTLDSVSRNAAAAADASIKSSGSAGGSMCSGAVVAGAAQRGGGSASVPRGIDVDGNSGRGGARGSSSGVDGTGLDAVLAAQAARVVDAKAHLREVRSARRHLVSALRRRGQLSWRWLEGEVVRRLAHAVTSVRDLMVRRTSTPLDGGRGAPAAAQNDLKVHLTLDGLSQIGAAAAAVVEALRSHPALRAPSTSGTADREALEAELERCVESLLPDVPPSPSRWLSGDDEPHRSAASALLSGAGLTSGAHAGQVAGGRTHPPSGRRGRLSSPSRYSTTSSETSTSTHPSDSCGENDRPACSATLDPSLSRGVDVSPHSAGSPSAARLSRLAMEAQTVRPAVLSIVVSAVKQWEQATLAHSFTAGDSDVCQHPRTAVLEVLKDLPPVPAVVGRLGWLTVADEKVWCTASDVRTRFKDGDAGAALLDRLVAQTHCVKIEVQRATADALHAEIAIACAADLDADTAPSSEVPSAQLDADGAVASALARVEAEETKLAAVSANPPTHADPVHEFTHPCGGSHSDGVCRAMPRASPTSESLAAKYSDWTQAVTAAVSKRLCAMGTRKGGDCADALRVPRTAVPTAFHQAVDAARKSSSTRQALLETLIQPLVVPLCVAVALALPTHTSSSSSSTQSPSHPREAASIADRWVWVLHSSASGVFPTNPPTALLAGLVTPSDRLDGSLAAEAGGVHVALPPHAFPLLADALSPTSSPPPRPHATALADVGEGERVANESWAPSAPRGAVAQSSVTAEFQYSVSPRPPHRSARRTQRDAPTSAFVLLQRCMMAAIEGCDALQATLCEATHAPPPPQSRDCLPEWLCGGRSSSVATGDVCEAVRDAADADATALQASLALAAVVADVCARAGSSFQDSHLSPLFPAPLLSTTTHAYAHLAEVVQDRDSSALDRRLAASAVHSCGVELLRCLQRGLGGADAAAVSFVMACARVGVYFCEKGARSSASRRVRLEGDLDVPQPASLVHVPYVRSSDSRRSSVSVADRTVDPSTTLREATASSLLSSLTDRLSTPHPLCTARSTLHDTLFERGSAAGRLLTSAAGACAQAVGGSAAAARKHAAAAAREAAQFAVAVGASEGRVRQLLVLLRRGGTGEGGADAACIASAVADHVEAIQQAHRTNAASRTPIRSWKKKRAQRLISSVPPATVGAHAQDPVRASPPPRNASPLLARTASPGGWSVRPSERTSASSSPRRRRAADPPAFSVVDHCSPQDGGAHSRPSSGGVGQRVSHAEPKRASAFTNVGAGRAPHVTTRAGGANVDAHVPSSRTAGCAVAGEGSGRRRVAHPSASVDKAALNYISRGQRQTTHVASMPGSVSSTPCRGGSCWAVEGDAAASAPLARALRHLSSPNAPSTPSHEQASVAHTTADQRTPLRGGRAVVSRADGDPLEGDSRWRLLDKVSSGRMYTGGDAARKKDFETSLRGGSAQEGLGARDVSVSTRGFSGSARIGGGLLLGKGGNVGQAKASPPAVKGGRTVASLFSTSSDCAAHIDDMACSPPPHSNSALGGAAGGGGVRIAVRGGGPLRADGVSVAPEAYAGGGPERESGCGGHGDDDVDHAEEAEATPADLCGACETPPRGSPPPAQLRAASYAPGGVSPVVEGRAVSPPLSATPPAGALPPSHLDPQALSMPSQPPREGLVLGALTPAVASTSSQPSPLAAPIAAPPPIPSPRRASGSLRSKSPAPAALHAGIGASFTDSLPAPERPRTPTFATPPRRLSVQSGCSSGGRGGSPVTVGSLVGSVRAPAPAQPIEASPPLSVTACARASSARSSRHSLEEDSPRTLACLQSPSPLTPATPPLAGVGMSMAAGTVEPAGHAVATHAGGLARGGPDFESTSTLLRDASVVATLFRPVVVWYEGSSPSDATENGGTSVEGGEYRWVKASSDLRRLDMQAAVVAAAGGGGGGVDSARSRVCKSSILLGKIQSVDVDVFDHTPPAVNGGFLHAVVVVSLVGGQQCRFGFPTEASARVWAEGADVVVGYGVEGVGTLATACRSLLLHTSTATQQRI